MSERYRKQPPGADRGPDSSSHGVHYNTIIMSMESNTTSRYKHISFPDTYLRGLWWQQVERSNQYVPLYRPSGQTGCVVLPMCFLCLLQVSPRVEVPQWAGWGTPFSDAQLSCRDLLLFLQRAQTHVYQLLNTWILCSLLAVGPKIIHWPLFHSDAKENCVHVHVKSICNIIFMHVIKIQMHPCRIWCIYYFNRTYTTPYTYCSFRWQLEKSQERQELNCLNKRKFSSRQRRTT